ncbi:unnamed protein product, partial [Ilex paraguariensis]
VIHKSAIDKKGGVKGARRDVEPCLGGSWIEIDARDGSEIDVEGAGEAGESLDSATAASDACGCLGSIRGTTYEVGLAGAKSNGSILDIVGVGETTVKN